MGKEVQELKEIKIIPNGKGGVNLYVNGELIDIKDTTDIHLDLAHDRSGGLVFELSMRKRVCFLRDYEYDFKRLAYGKENS